MIIAFKFLIYCTLEKENDAAASNTVVRIKYKAYY
jgi:hypothetical protein